MIDQRIKEKFRIYLKDFKHIQSWGIVGEHFQVNIYSKWYYRKPKISRMFGGYHVMINKIKRTELL
jgi:hypothetical protein